MFSYKLLNGKGGFFSYSDTNYGEDITANQACEYLKKKHDSLQKDVVLILAGKVIPGKNKLKNYNLQEKCCVHVLNDPKCDPKYEKK